MLKAKIRELKAKHIVMNRPYLALIVMPFWTAVMKNIISIPDQILRQFWPVYRIGIFAILCAFICLSFHKKWFSPSFKGNLRWKTRERDFSSFSPWPNSLSAILQSLKMPPD